MNKMIIIGNLATDPVLREVQSATGLNKVCNFNVAVNERRNGQERTTFFAVSAWGNYAMSCKQFLAKGRKVYVAGALSATTYAGSDGTTRVSLNISANDIEFLSPAPVVNAPAAYAPAANAPAAPMPNYDAPTPAPAQNYEAPANNYAAPVPVAAPGFAIAQPDELPF